MAFGNIGTIWAEIGLETTNLQKGVSKAKMQLSALDRTAMTQAASINAKLQTIGTGLQSVGKKMTMYATLPLLAVGAASVKAGSDFESGMTKSLAIMNSVSPQIRAQMELTAKSIVDYTTFSAKEGADAYFYLASAGLDAAQSMEALPRVAKFAQAGNFDLALATDLLTDAQSALGLTIRDDVVKNMENMTRVSDVLVKANTLSNATVQQFSESLTNKAGAAMKLLNKDIEEGVAVLAAWADQGVKGTEAGNYLNIVLRDLQTAAIKNGDTFEDFSIDVYDTSGNMRNMADVVGDLENALDGMSDKEKRATLMMLGFQDRSISAMMTLLGTSDAIRGYESDLRDATGYTEDVADKQMESFAASVEQLKNQFVLIGIEIFDILKPKLEGLIEQVKKGIGWWNNLTDTQQKWVVTLGIVGAAIGPVLIGLGSMVKAVATLRTGFISLKIASHGALGPVGLVIAAITVLNLATGYGIDKLEQYDTLWSHLGSSVLGGLNPIKASIGPFQRVNAAIKEYEKGNISLTGAMFMLKKEGKELVRQNEEIENGVYNTTEAYQSAERFIKNYSDELPIATDEMYDLIKKLQDGNISLEAFTIGIEELRKATENGHTDIEDLNIATAELNNTNEIAAWKLRELAKEEQNAGVDVGDTTEDIKNQEGAVDNLLSAFERGDIESSDFLEGLKELGIVAEDAEGAFEALIHDMFRTFNINAAVEESTDSYNESLKKLTNSYGTHQASQRDIQNAQWAYEDALNRQQKVLEDVNATERDRLSVQWEVDDALNKLNRTSGTYTTSEEARNEIIKEHIGNMETLHLDMLIQFHDNDTSVEQQEEIQKQFIESSLLAVEYGATSTEEFANAAVAFGLSGSEIIKYAGEMGIELDTVTRARLIKIDMDTSAVGPAVTGILIELNKIPKTITTEHILYNKTITSMSDAPAQPTKLSMGGIVGYANGGIIGNDGAKVPPLTASMGIVTPQTGRAIPIMAHENEVVLNTGQQKNLAELIFNTANKGGAASSKGQDINVPVVVYLDGEVIYEKTSQYQYDGAQTKARLG